jgi:hypothetical protein
MCLNDSVIGYYPIEKQSSSIVEAENKFALQKAASNDSQAYHICPGSARKKKLILCRTYIKYECIFAIGVLCLGDLKSNAPHFLTREGAKDARKTRGGK